MFKIKNITMKNFLSVGAITQSINLGENGLTLVLGDNLDQGSNGSRNGTGKSTILHAISFALYGQPMSNIKKDNLINKINGKNMLVTIEFEKGGHQYRIERGRKPSKFKYIVDNNVVNEENTDEAQGDNRLTQEDIDQVVGLSHLMFKHIIALSTKVTPFLSEKQSVQRELIEELLGITQLSMKADQLKELAKQTKEDIEKEEFKIKLLQQQNDKTQKTINEITAKSNSWVIRHETNITEYTNRINTLMELDIESELKLHADLIEFKKIDAELKELKRSYLSEKSLHDNLLNQIAKLEMDYNSILEHKCNSCGQKLHNDKHEQLKLKIENDLTTKCEEFNLHEEKFKITSSQMNDKEQLLHSLGKCPVTFYSKIEQAYEHKNNLDVLISNMENEIKLENPYIDQIETIQSNSIVSIDYDNLNLLVRIKEHQEFLLKLLTDKNSVVRKQIIEQNLSYLNARLEHYLEKLNLPHKVKFQSDLTVEITTLGQDFDFDNLSTGESTRVILALSWAFRDVFETLNFPISLLFIDELIDNGMDSSGGEHSLSLLKQSARERGKNIFLISHKDEFISRVSTVLMVTKEDGFTSYSYEDDVQI